MSDIYYDVNGWRLMHMDVRMTTTVTHHVNKDGRTRVTHTQYDADGNIEDVSIAYYDRDGLLMEGKKPWK